MIFDKKGLKEIFNVFKLLNKSIYNDRLDRKGILTAIGY